MTYLVVTSELSTQKNPFKSLKGFSIVSYEKCYLHN